MNMTLSPSHAKNIADIFTRGSPPLRILQISSPFVKISRLFFLFSAIHSHKNVSNDEMPDMQFKKVELNQVK